MSTNNWYELMIVDPKEDYELELAKRQVMRAVRERAISLMIKQRLEELEIIRKKII